ncbi:phosphatase PAP2 family protein [Demequina aurantiaca]|uniref:phosphatase PAP2 family protein n=1 Tax=Demequina aurantiaca TaxID=676200 RepID=UPI000782AFA0|nr:phosphatase PAP2 family protein [Demequina aurantiaca]
MSLTDRFHKMPNAWQAILPGALLLLVGGAAFAAILDSVLEGNDIETWDQPMLDWMVSIRTPWLTDVMTFVTNMFGPVILPIIVAVACAIWGIVTRRWRDPILLASAMVMSTVLSTVIKLVVQRPRPEEDLQVVPGFETSFSFPSGHTTGASTLVLVAGYLLWRERRSKTMLAVWMVASVFIIGLVGASRLYLGYHFLSDVLAGACLGLVTLGLVVTASRLLDLRAGRDPGRPDEGDPALEGTKDAVT